MRLSFAALAGVFLLAACGQSIQARCAAAHTGDAAAEHRCVKIAEARLLTGPGSAFTKKQRGGPG